MSAHLQQEVEEDCHTSIKGEAPYSWHAGHSSQEEGSCLGERGEQKARSHFTNTPTNQLPDADMR